MAEADILANVFKRVNSNLEDQLKVASYFNDPVAFCRDVFGYHLWSKQQETANSLVHNKKTVVAASHATGKSDSAAAFACWWIATRSSDVHNVLVATTAPSNAQVRGVLWDKIKRFFGIAQQRYDAGITTVRLPGYITQQARWKTDTGDQIGFGSKPPAGSDSIFQGYHKKYTLVILDEAAAVPKELWTGADAITTTDTCRILAIGNPTDPNSLMAKIWNDPDSNWNKIKISIFDTPNFTKKFIHEPHSDFYEDALKRWEVDQNLPQEVFDLTVGEGWYEDVCQQWGEDSVWVKSRALAEFPEQAINSLFDMSTIYRGHNVSVLPETDRRRSLGVDVARYGEDYSAVYMYSEGHILEEDGSSDVWADPSATTHRNVKATTRIGGQLRLLGKRSKSSLIDTMKWVHELAVEHAVHEVRIDAVALGAGAFEILTELAGDLYTVIDMVGNTRSPDNTKWMNARAYWYDTLREKTHRGELDLDPDDTRLADELTAIQYHFSNKQESLQIESKEDMKRAGRKSPDFADAAVYAAADLDHVYDNPLQGMAVGERIAYYPDEIINFDTTSYYAPY